MYLIKLSDQLKKKADDEVKKREGIEERKKKREDKKKEKTGKKCRKEVVLSQSEEDEEMIMDDTDEELEDMGVMPELTYVLKKRKRKVVDERGDSSLIVCEEADSIVCEEDNSIVCEEDVTIVCETCKLRDPVCASGSVIDWVCCFICDKWHHTVCVREHGDDYVCENCIKC